jgi:hypothetical protein
MNTFFMRKEDKNGGLRVCAPDLCRQLLDRHRKYIKRLQEMRLRSMQAFSTSKQLPPVQLSGPAKLEFKLQRLRLYQKFGRDRHYSLAARISNIGSLPSLIEIALAV